MSDKQRVTVIGAGVIGLNVAWRLAEQGAAVTVVEASQPGGGTSSTSFAWLNASSKIDYDPAYFELNAQALREHAVLNRAAPASSWAHFTGDVEVAATAVDADALADKVERLRALGYAAEMLTADKLASLEPGTILPREGAAAFYADEGWADVGRFVSALTEACRSQGVTLVAGDPAREVLRRNGRAAGLRLASGAAVEADTVVVALGRWTPEFAASLSVEVPLVSSETAGSRALGLLVRVRPSQGAPRRLLHSPAVNWSPLANGRALLASDAGDAAVAQDRGPAATGTAAEVLVRQAAALNPLFENAEIEHAGIGIRALPSDGIAICGWMREVPGLYVAVTHSGMTLSPLLGHLVAREVAGETVDLLQSFRPDRFRAAA